MESPIHKFNKNHFAEITQKHLFYVEVKYY